MHTSNDNEDSRRVHKFQIPAGTFAAVARISWRSEVNSEIARVATQVTLWAFWAVAVWGRDDQFVPAANAAGLGNAATVHIVDGVGHMAHLEKPQAVVAGIREALGA